MEPEERWEWIVDQSYEISNLGRVGSRKGWCGSRRILKPSTRGGYLSLTLKTLSGKYKVFSLHRLVAELFVGHRPTPSHQVNHKDGDKANNRADNLEWVTAEENARHALSVLHVRRGTGPVGERNGHARLSRRDVRAVRGRIALGESDSAIAGSYNITPSAIHAIRVRRTWRWLE